MRAGQDGHGLGVPAAPAPSTCCSPCCAQVVAGLKALIADPDITVRQLMRHIPAPDFPTGARLLRLRPAAPPGFWPSHTLAAGLRLPTCSLPPPLPLPCTPSTPQAARSS